MANYLTLKQEISPIIDRIDYSADLEQVVKKVDFVLEAIVKNLEIKKKVFQHLGNARTRKRSL